MIHQLEISVLFHSKKNYMLPQFWFDFNKTERNGTKWKVNHHANKMYTHTLNQIQIEEEEKEEKNRKNSEKDKFHQMLD